MMLCQIKQRIEDSNLYSQNRNLFCCLYNNPLQMLVIPIVSPCFRTTCRVTQQSRFNRHSTILPLPGYRYHLSRKVQSFWLQVTISYWYIVTLDIPKKASACKVTTDLPLHDFFRLEKPASIELRIQITPLWFTTNILFSAKNRSFY